MVIIRKKHKETAQEKEIRQQKQREQAMGIQDQYQARGFELVTFVQENKILVSCIIVALVLGGALFSAYLYYQELSLEKASSEFLETLKKVEEMGTGGEENVAKRQEVQAGLIQLADTHKRTGVATLANLYAAHFALENNDAKKSIELYENALLKIKTSDSLYPLARIGLAYAQERAGDNKNALGIFESVIEIKDGLGKDLALWEAARLSRDLNDKEKSKQYLARLLEEYPASVYEKNARRLREEVVQ